MDWDVFISHAWEDKKNIARPLAEALGRAGLRVWYDEFTLTLGDSLRRSIDRGLAQSRYGVVILSPHFFAKEWPQRELDGLVAREISSGKTILPIWHNVTREDVSRFSPTLADKLAVSTAKGLDAVVEEILRALRVDLKPELTREEHQPTPRSVVEKVVPPLVKPAAVAEKPKPLTVPLPHPPRSELEAGSRAGALSAVAIIVLNLIDLIPYASCVTAILRLPVYMAVGARAAFELRLPLWYHLRRERYFKAGAIGGVVAGIINGIVNMIISTLRFAISGGSGFMMSKLPTDVMRQLYDASIDPAIFASIGGVIGISAACCVIGSVLAAVLGAIGGVIFGPSSRSSDLY